MTRKGTKAEGEAVAAILSEAGIECQPLTDDSATEQHLLAVQQPRVLHIASHGFVLPNEESSDPMVRSGVMAAGFNRYLALNDATATVTALKLSGMQLRGTDVVVLSCCDTARHDDRALSTGMSHVSKALIQAGAKAVMASLWPLNDQATVDLMKRFYAQWLDPQYPIAPALALRQTKLNAIGNHIHPTLWAPLVWVGW